MADARTNSPGNALWAELPVSPDAYPQKLDLARDLVLVIRLDAPAYRAASFLDDRILTPATQGTWFPSGRVLEAAGRVSNPRPLHYIFHSGHVGSTLLSRLLEAYGETLAVREPLPLRTLAEAHEVLGRPEALIDPGSFKALLDALQRLWSRGYAQTRAVVVKATSSAGSLAPALLEGGESRAVCLNLKAEPYLATLLAGQNSIQDLRGHGPGRMRRLLACSPSAATAPLHALSPGELAALGWLVETGSQTEAAWRFPERVLPLDFDAFLADVPGGMSRVLNHFALPHDERLLADVGASPVMRSYSKAPDRPFTPQDRVELLRDSRRRHAAQIGRGIAWLERLARGDGTVADIVAAGR